MPAASRRFLRRAVLALLPALLASCGGGGGGSEAPASCSVTDQKAWLADYMNDWYFWYRLSPHPDPGAYSSVDSLFSALLYQGTDVNFPADRWSYTQSTEAFNRFFGDGQTLGYGLSVAGIEVTGRPDLPLYVRYVEPQSDAAARGVVRGDQILSINGRSAADIIAANDYSVLSPAAAGNTIALVLRNSGGDRSVTLTASIFALTPVSTSSVLTTPLGRKLGYVVVKDMINQVTTPLENAFASFRAAGVSDVVLDLRYNGGGLVSVGATVASYPSGAVASGRTYASLLYNDRHAANNVRYTFGDPTSALGLGRVFVLTGSRTCSASEQVINGLRGVGVEVIAIGDTTCGKPVGFLPSSQCGTTYSVVNFESVNERNEGRYFNGFAATCSVAEDFTQPLGSPAEPLLNAARSYADNGVCPAGTTARALSAPRRTLLRGAPEPGERQGMLDR